MTDFNKLLTPGDLANNTINTVIEIPEKSILKIEYRRGTATFVVDRVEPAIFAKPVNYGFIPQTLDGDGDELDTLIVCDEPLPTGVHLSTRILGVMVFEDDGEVDNKIVCVPADDRNNGSKYQTVEDLGEAWKKRVEHHFNHYKDLKKPGSTKVTGWGNTEEAKKIIEECIERFKKEA